MTSLFSFAARAKGAWRLGFALLLLMFSTFTLQAKEYEAEQQRID